MTTFELTGDRLRALLIYGRFSGEFRWRARTTKYSHVNVDDVAGSVDKRTGYVRDQDRPAILSSSKTSLLVHGQ